MNEEIDRTFVNTLREIMIIEKLKKEISHQMLIVKDKQSKNKLIYDFLGYDLDKHEMMQEATLHAIENNDDTVLNRIQIIYSWSEEEVEVIEKISAQIKRTRSYMSTIKRAIDTPHFISFIERRFVQEISKYVLAQARLYTRILSK